MIIALMIVISIALHGMCLIISGLIMIPVVFIRLLYKSDKIKPVLPVYSFNKDNVVYLNGSKCSG